MAREIFQFLLQSGASPNVYNIHHMRLIHLTVIDGEFEFAHLLIEQGKKVVMRKRIGLPDFFQEQRLIPLQEYIERICCILSVIELLNNLRKIFFQFFAR